MMNKKVQSRCYETAHDENLFIAKLLGIVTICISLFYTIRGMFMGKTIARGIIKSWVSGWGIVLLLFVILTALIFFLDWLLYSCVKKIVIRKGEAHSAIVASEIEVRHAHKGAVYQSWKYVIELEDYSTYLSTAYTSQIPLRKKCTVYVLGSKCIITSFETDRTLYL